MRYLVDTHVLIWAVSWSEKLSAVARRALAQVDGSYFFSPVSHIIHPLKSQHLIIGFELFGNTILQGGLFFVECTIQI